MEIPTKNVRVIRAMPNWKEIMDDFLFTIKTPSFGAGFLKEGVDPGSHPNLVTFDGTSAYFFRLGKKEADRLLDGVTMLSGYTGWLAYILQELFFQESAGDALYGEIFDGLSTGVIRGPDQMSREAIYNWVEEVAPSVERILRRLCFGAGPY